MKIYNKIYSIGLACLQKAAAILFVVLVVACTTDSDTPIDDGCRPIYFAIDESDDDTRAIVNNFTDFTANNFGVTAYWYPDNDISQTPKVAIDNQKINVDGSGCSVEGNYKYYWAQGTWHFAAYSPWVEDPSAAPVKITPPSKVFGGYTFSGTVDGKTDYMFADEEAGYYGINGDNLQKLDGSAVAMRFRHALTKVTFGLRLSDATNGTNVTFNGLSLSNVRNTGSVSFVHGNDALNNRNDRNRWTTKDASGAPINDRWSVNDAQTTGYEVAPSGTPIKITDENEHKLDKVLYLLPQELLASGTQQTINVSYTLQIGSNTPTTHTVSIPVRNGSIEQWSTNSHVHYTLTVNPPGGTASLDVAVQPWDLVEFTNQFSNTVVVNQSGRIKWTEGTYNTLNGYDLVLLDDISTPAEMTFTISGPLGGTWQAIFVTKSGDPNAFTLSQSEGEVGRPVTLRVGARQQNTSDISNQAELRFVVRTSSNILPVDALTDDEGANYNIIQNINK